MKVATFLHLSFVNLFIFLQVTFANTTSHALDQFPKNPSVNPNSVPSSSSLEKSLKNPDRFIKQDGISDSPNDYEAFLEGDKKTSNFKRQFHIFKIKPEYIRKKDYVNTNLNDRPSRINVSPFHHNFNNFLKLFDYNLQKRGYYDPYYSDLYHSNRFNDYGRHVLQPYLRSSYGSHNVPERFTNRRKSLDTFLFGNQDRYPEKINIYSFSNNHPNSLISTENAYLPEKNFPIAADIDKSDTGVISTPEKTPSDKSKTAQDILSSIFSKSRKFMTIPRDLSVTENSLGKATVPNQSLTTRKHHLAFSDLDSDPEYEDSYDESESNKLSLPDDAQMRLERDESKNRSLDDHLQTGNLNFSENNKVYYEKMPDNFNLPWFLYSNCSRDKCHFTNSTNETDLAEKGWVMHNCTSDGCTEMYPRTEAMQKFIGLILFVFSLCVMKITVFVVIFYYCRHIKMSMHESEDGNSKPEDEENTEFLPNQSKNLKEEGTKASKTRAKQVQESKFTPHKQSVDNSGDENNLNSDVLNGSDRKVSKIWLPPDQQVSSCLMSAGDILIPKKISLKRSPKVRNMKCKGRNRSGIPRLEKLEKNRVRHDDRLEANILEDKSFPKVPAKCDQPGRNEEILLMDLDGEIDTNNMNSVCNNKKVSDWEASLKDECQSFINLSLSDEELFSK